MSLIMPSNNTKLTLTPTAAGEVYVQIIARTSSAVTYTEQYADGTTETFTDEAMDAGQVFYGLFTALSSTSGHVVVNR